MPDELIGYESQFEPDPSYDDVMVERSRWIADYHRRTEESRDQQSQGREPLLGHDHDERVSGYNPEMEIDQLTALVMNTAPH